MSESQQSPVFKFDNSDPEMQRAYENARATFRYFWREVPLDRRRMLPALEIASVKAPFCDGARNGGTDDTPDVEHMWLSEIDFDGQFVSGVLQNDPSWLKTVKKGDRARIPLDEISDWLYTISDEVFGAYTVNLMRSRMGRQERQQHDEAWGLNFGDPKKIRVAPEPKKGRGLLKNWFGSAPADMEDHPMSETMASVLKNQLADNPSLVSATDDKGWTLLHQEALAGNAASVNVLLEAGADPSAVTDHGQTPLQLAKSLGRDRVVALLARK
jgi:uncharacterized protein YegJ (DUF2314 family)